MPETNTNQEFDPATNRYCEKCGAQINGEGAWGHDDNCPHKK